MHIRIKQLRKALGMSQKDFSTPLGVKQSTIANWETQKQVCPKNMIVAICQTFRVNRAWLERGEGEMFAPKNPLTDEQTFIETAFALIKSLPEDKQTIFCDLARRLLIDNENPADVARDVVEELKRRREMEESATTNQTIVNNSGVVVGRTYGRPIFDLRGEPESK